MGKQEEKSDGRLGRRMQEEIRVMARNEEEAGCKQRLRKEGDGLGEKKGHGRGNDEDELGREERKEDGEGDKERQGR